MSLEQKIVRVKICGITNWADARAACDLGAYALGFNFYDKSPRVVAPATAWAIRKKMPEQIESIGVFVNWQPRAVTALSRSLHLHAAQLHGDEPPGDIPLIGVPVIKVFRVDPGFKLSVLNRYASYAFLFDAARRGRYGGTGQTTDWGLARKAAHKRMIILAGGLTPENVAEAIRTVRPYAVDVASGVESRPGKKDPAKLRAFFAEVARANRELAS